MGWLRRVLGRDVKDVTPEVEPDTGPPEPDPADHDADPDPAPVEEG